MWQISWSIHVPVPSNPAFVLDILHIKHKSNEKIGASFQMQKPSQDGRTLLLTAVDGSKIPYLQPTWDVRETAAMSQWFRSDQV